MKRKQMAAGTLAAMDAFTADPKLKFLHVSIRVLARNLASDRELSLSVKSLAQDMSTIKSICSTKGRGLRFWLPAYDRVIKTASGVTWRKIKDETKAKDMLTLTTKVCWELYSSDLGETITLGFQNPRTIKEEELSGAALLVLSMVDLAWLPYRFTPVLIDSFTGSIKPRRDWSLKFMPLDRAVLSGLAFNQFTLAVFGDRLMVKPKTVKCRRAVLEISADWDLDTTEQRMVSMTRGISGLGLGLDIFPIT